jgi:hypothetical protein
MENPFQLYDFFQISIIEDSIDNVIKNFTTILSDSKLTKENLANLDFNNVCSERTIPYNPTKRKFILFEPASNPGTTVFFPNLTDGWYTLLYNYTRLYKKNVFKAGFTTNATMPYPAYFFKYFYIDNNNLIERSVHAIKEDKWVFFANSVPLTIEDPTNYSKRKIVDRLNNNIILDYLQKAGYDLRSDTFFETTKSISLITC